MNELTTNTGSQIKLSLNLSYGDLPISRLTGFTLHFYTDPSYRFTVTEKDLDKYYHIEEDKAEVIVDTTKMRSGNIMCQIIAVVEDELGIPDKEYNGRKVLKEMATVNTGIIIQQLVWCV